MVRSVNYRPISPEPRFWEMQLLGMLTSRHFAGFSILMSEIKPENFRSVSQRLAILQNKLQNTEHPIKCELVHVTRDWVMSYHPYLDTDKVFMNSRTEIGIS